MGTHWECLDNCLFVSIMSWVLIGSVLTTVYLSPLCHGYSLGVSCQSSICLHDVKGTHYGCIVNYLFVSMMSRVLPRSALDNCLFASILPWVFIEGVLLILYLSPLCHGYSFGVS